MKKNTFSESKIFKILKEVDTGVPIKDVCREHGISASTYHRWKGKYGGMEASDMRRLKELEAENRRLKQMFADLSLDHQVLKELLEKK